MNPDPIVLNSRDIVRTAIQYIMDHRFRNVAVVDAAGRYLGMFGVRCLLRLVLPKALTMEDGLDDASFINESLSELHERLREVEQQPVALCVSKDVPTVAPDTSLAEALLVMYRSHSSIAVVEPDTGRLLGVISYWDVGAKILAA